MGELYTQMDTNPLHFIQFYLNRKGKGSLIHFLKKKNFITKLNVDVDLMKQFSIFEISLILTKNGMDNVYNVFAYFLILGIESHNWFPKSIE